MAFNGEMTVNEAKENMGHIWKTIEDGENGVSVRMTVLGLQFRNMAICKERMLVVQAVENARIDAFRARAAGDVRLAAEVESWLFDWALLLAYDRAESKRIGGLIGDAAKKNAALVARCRKVAA